MKAVESSMEEEDECIIETVATKKKKKMKQAQLPFQMLSSKSSDTQHNMRTKKKRKLASPLVEVKRSKVIKLSTKENSARNISEDKREDLEEMDLDDANELKVLEVIKKERRKDREQITQQTHESKKEHITPKKKLLKKHKKLDKFQQKSGALTKFLKMSNKEARSAARESLERDSCQNPDPNITVLSSDDEASSKVNKSTLSKKVINESASVVTPTLHRKKKKVKNSALKQLDSSSENETASELEESTLSTRKKVINKSASVVTLTPDRKKKKVKNSAPKQSDSSSENETVSELEESMLNTGKKVINESVSVVTPPEKKKKKKVKNSAPKQLDSSSENETVSESEKSTLSTSKKIINESTSVVTPTSDKKKKKVKVLTPQQLEKEQELARRKEEKLKLREERRKQREMEKANRRRQREERQREKEERERIEKEEKRKEKQLKELKKQMEIEQKQKEREAKEEERRKREEAKVEEKRKKEEEKLEAERRKQKAASNFASFFVTKKQEAKSAEEEAAIETNFMPFEIKTDMRVAPVNRRTMTAEEKLFLDRNFNANVPHKQLYLEDVIHRRHVSKTCPRTWPLEAKDDEIVLLDEDNDGTSNNNIIKDTHNLEKLRPKLLQFCENRRPPYWGTWRKRSDVITPTQPLLKDQKWFDYAVDSDDEWEEEEPGESLKGSDDEKDDENPEENEYDVDNEFMVPHGYLSDEEARADEEEMEDMSPQTQKMKLKILGEQFEAERNTKTQKLKPKLIGCVWQGPGNTFPESTPPKIKELLLARQAWVSNIPIILPSAECKTQATQQSVREKTKSKRTKLSGETLPDVLQLLQHGNTRRKRLSAKKAKKNTETEITKQRTTNST